MQSLNITDETGFPCEGMAPGYAAFFTPQRLAQLREIHRAVSVSSFFPRAENVLRFTRLDPEHLRCVIVGMDPYPSFTRDAAGEIVPEATGRSFEVASVRDWGGKYRQASLRNILKALYLLKTGVVPSMEELRAALDGGSFSLLPPHPWMDAMEAQGVLFLNASLTLEPGKPGSHTLLWQDFMTDLMDFLARRSPDAVWLLWGAVAQARVPDSVVRKVCSSHPRLPRFITECPFARVPSVNWVVEEDAGARR